MGRVRSAGVLVTFLLTLSACNMGELGGVFGDEDKNQVGGGGNGDDGGDDGVVESGEPIQIATGTYEGTNADQSITGLGFSPTVVMLKADSGFYCLAPYVDDGSYVASLDADGFSLGANGATNAASTNYYYAAFDLSLNPGAVGSYEGDGTGERDVAAGNFLPSFALVSYAMGGLALPVSKTAVMNEGQSVSVGGDALADGVLALHEGGFRVGAGLNEDGVGYTYVLLPSVSQVDTGTYIGDGTSERVITSAVTPVFTWLQPLGTNRLRTYRWDPMGPDSSLRDAQTFTADGVGQGDGSAFLARGSLANEADIPYYYLTIGNLE